LAKQVLILFDRCVGCRSCQLACAVAHSEARNLFGAVVGGEKPRSRVFVHQAGARKGPLNCRHCQDAPCIDACITGAMHRREDGTVTNVGGAQTCTACWMCLMVCPYGAVVGDEAGTAAVKCDRECKNTAGVPACVKACPTGALTYGEVDDFSARRREDVLRRVLA